jgi:SAM-dependent methyltransferase
MDSTQAHIARVLPRPVKQVLFPLMMRLMPSLAPRVVVSPRNSDFIPFIRSCLRQDVRTVLDIGCGKLWDGNPPSEDYLLSIFNSPQFLVTGLDIFPDCVTWRKENGPPGEYLCLDARQAPTLGRHFDLVIAHHVIEHFDKETGPQLLDDWEGMATKQVIIGTPVGLTDTAYAVELHGNEAERHKSGWLPEEFTARGYTLVHQYAGAFLVQKQMS